jgi:hypothetical protein
MTNEDSCTADCDWDEFATQSRRFLHMFEIHEMPPLDPRSLPLGQFSSGGVRLLAGA